MTTPSKNDSAFEKCKADNCDAGLGRPPVKLPVEAAGASAAESEPVAYADEALSNTLPANLLPSVPQIEDSEEPRPKPTQDLLDKPSARLQRDMTQLRLSLSAVTNPFKEIARRLQRLASMFDEMAEMWAPAEAELWAEVEAKWSARVEAELHQLRRIEQDDDIG